MKLLILTAVRVPLIEPAERLGPGAHIHGLHPSSAAMTRAAQKMASRERGPDRLNLGVNSYEDRPESIRERRRVAKSGAVMG
jgi:hypothetical protein